MKRGLIITGIVILLVAGAAGIGWLYFRANPSAWDAFLAEMDADTNAAPAPRPAERSSRQAGVLLASGSIEAEEVSVSSQLGGRIVEILVGEGSIVEAGDLLLRLDESELEVQRQGAQGAVVQAQAALEAAQAQLDLARAGATAEEIALAEAAVLSAQGAVAAAEAALAQAQISVQSARTVEAAESSVALAEAGLAQAEGVLDAAQANLDIARAEQARLLAGARSQEIAIQQALLNQAQAQYLYVKDFHTELIENNVGGRPEERARLQADSARGARDAAQAQLDLVLAGPSQEERAAARAAVSAAEAQVTIAEAGVAAAEATLSQAQSSPQTTSDQVALAEAGVNAAQAQIDTANGQLAQAQAELNRLRAGATSQQIAVLEAQVAQAEAAVVTAEAAVAALDINLSHALVKAPSGGIILQRLAHGGELAAPGASLFTIADLDEVTLTVYIPEAELGLVSLGQSVDVTVDAYEESFAGSVSHIASEAEFTPRNVQTQEERVHMVFAVKIRLANPDHRLKPGMPADASFE